MQMSVKSAIILVRLVQDLYRQTAILATLIDIITLIRILVRSVKLLKTLCLAHKIKYNAGLDSSMKANLKPVLNAPKTV